MCLPTKTKKSKEKKATHTGGAARSEFLATIWLKNAEVIYQYDFFFFFFL